MRHNRNNGAEVSAVIVASLLLIVVAVGLLALGLLDGSNGSLAGSIAASLLASVALVVGGRQTAARRAADPAGRSRRGAPGERAKPDRELVGAGVRGAAGRPAGPVGDRADGGVAERTGGAPATEVVTGEVMTDRGPVRDQVGPAERVPAGRGPVVPAQDRGSALPVQDRGPVSPAPAPSPGPQAGVEDRSKPDEPQAQQTSAGDAARVARLAFEVHVIDGRPRYHVRSCVHLLGRVSQALAARDAVELGFTPCGLCEPDSKLLGRARSGNG